MDENNPATPQPSLQEQHNEDTGNNQDAGGTEIHTAREAELERQLADLQNQINALKAENQKLFINNRDQDKPKQLTPMEEAQAAVNNFVTHGFDPTYLGG